MPLAAMSSFIVSYRDTSTVGLASQTIDCEWSSEVDHAGGKAYSARLTVSHGQPIAISVADALPGASAVRVIAVRVSGGGATVSCPSINALVQAGEAACWSSSEGAAWEEVSITAASQAAAVVEIVMIGA